jgi:hypothetical protein
MKGAEMQSNDGVDPYGGNILVRGLGPILSRMQVLEKLTYLPPPPRDIGNIPKYIRLHYLAQIRDLHITGLEEARLHETIDLMKRQGYRYRDPSDTRTWTIVGGGSVATKSVRAPAMGCLVVGNSGVGKTEAIHRTLNLSPKQVITHATFPGLVGGHQQVVWQSVGVPASGKAHDLAASLMTAWDTTMRQYLPGSEPRFTKQLTREKRDGAKMLEEWRQVVSAHFLGVLHLDEVQNLFKLPTLEARGKKSARQEELELRIIDDQSLKLLLELMNISGIPLILSGTPDGVGALMKRFATIQRSVANGFHLLPRFQGPDELEFYTGFLKPLFTYQYVKVPLVLTPDVAKVVYGLSGGIHRLIIALWIAAHRVAFERADDDLRVSDFYQGASTYLAPVAPAVAALLSNDPREMRRYEDLIKLDDNFWSVFYGRAA